MTLKRTSDRKVTNSVTPKGNVRIANAFSLPAGISCPGMTGYCQKICYAGKLEKIYKGFRDTVLYNWNMLKGLDWAGMYTLLDSMIDDFEAECDKWNAPKHFRIHADGDFFSLDYTQAWGNVIMDHPNVQFWVYTRVPESAIELNPLENCSVYFSADPENVLVARRLMDQGIRIAMLDDTFDDARALIGTKAVRCPENNKAIPLISERGSACERCGLCIFGRNNVLFSRTKH